MARILVIDGDVRVQQLLRQVLATTGHDVQIAPDAPEGLRAIAMDSPELVLLDVDLPSGDGYAIVERIRQDEGPTGHVPVIMLTGSKNVEQKIRALRAGADDYLIKPTDPAFHPAELLARIRGLLARFARPDVPVASAAMGRVIAFYGAKGGVGTTTTAINTAIALKRELGRTVCLIDGNLQFGDHRVFLDLSQDLKSIVDVATARGIDSSVVRRVLAKHESGIELLLAPPAPESAELVRPEHVGAVVNVLRGMFDYTLVDIDRRLDDNSLALIDAAEEIFVVMTADLSSLKNVRQVLRTLERLGYPANKFRLVLSRSTAATGISIKSAEGALGQAIDYRIVNDFRGAVGALNSGSPFMVAKADSPLARSILDFAKSIDRERRAPASTGDRPAGALIGRPLPRATDQRW